MNSLERQYFDSLCLQVRDLEVEPIGQQAATNCDCCGGTSCSVWGYLHLKQAGTVAAYFAQWTAGASLALHPANFYFIIGPWGEGVLPGQRCAVSLAQFDGDEGPGVMLIDAASRPIAQGSLATIIASREDVIGTPFAKSVFTLYDSVILLDGRLVQFLR